MKQLLKYLAVVCIMASSLSACRKEMTFLENKYVVIQPQEYAELYEIYKGGFSLNNAEFTDDYTSLLFSNGKNVVMDCKLMPVDSCKTEQDIRTLSLDADNYWLLDGNPTGKKYIDTLSLADSEPVYIYLTSQALSVCAGNGQEFKINYDYVDSRYPRYYQKCIPVVSLFTDGKAPVVSKEDYVAGNIIVSDQCHVCSDVETFSARMKIRGRGNSTWDLSSKKPYKIKLEEKSQLLGMPSDKEWCVLANYSDKTLIRNLLAMEMSRICNFPWTPKMMSVKLYMNGKYQGVYTFSEHKKVSKNRVNIDTDEGEVYLEVDARFGDPVNFSSNTWKVPICFSDPEQPSQKVYDKVKKIINNFESKLAGDDARVLDRIDVRSFVDYFIVNELSKNVDANFYLSSFITIQQDDKIKLYHLWDFDLAFGNCNYLTDCGPYGWYIKTGSGWYRHLFKNKAFVEQVKSRWNELYPSFLKLTYFIDQQVYLLGDDVSRNFTEWPILDKYVWPNYKINNTYEGEIAYLKDFYLKRLEWMNTSINAL